MINYPPHYTQGSIEPIDVITDWALGFELGNAVKYIARSAHKGAELEDLEKARWYLARKIGHLRAAMQREANQRIIDGEGRVDLD